MKKSLSIVLAGILVLNVLGYYGVFLGMHYRNDVAMLQALDSDTYDEAQEITIQVPVSIPYMPDQSGFNRVNGKFEYKGELYRLVKQKYAKDTLTVICIKDTEHKKIDKQLGDYVKSFTDQAPSGKNTSKLTLNFIKDYISTTFAIGSATAGWTSKVSYSSSQGTLFPSFSTSITQPPEHV